MRQGLRNDTVSVRPSVPSCAAAAAAEAQLQRRRSMGLSSKCEQCHVYSRRIYEAKHRLVRAIF